MCIKGSCPFTLFGQQHGDHTMQGSCAQLKEAVSCWDRRPSARPPRGRRAKGEGGQRPELLTSQDLDAATANATTAPAGCGLGPARLSRCC